MGDSSSTVPSSKRATSPSVAREITIPGTAKVVKAKFLTGDEPKWKGNEPTRGVLADWITSPKNPYFAKATADMVWQYFFGVSLLEPIMEPSDDSPITHPQLLNDLAESLIAHDFDLKFLMRAIVHTQAYQRSSGNHGKVTKDDYVLFTRMPVRGMSPEQLYDSVIEAVIGPKGHDASGIYQPNFEFGPRQGNVGRAEFLAKFVNQDKRHESQTSILQALFLMNGKFLADKIKSNENLDIIALEVSQHPGKGPHVVRDDAVARAAGRGICAADSVRRRRRGHSARAIRRRVVGARQQRRVPIESLTLPKIAACQPAALARAALASAAGWKCFGPVHSMRVMMVIQRRFGAEDLRQQTAAQLVRRALALDAAVLQAQHVMGVLVNDGQIVRHQQDGHAAFAG